MTGQQSRRWNHVSGTAIRRRQALAGLISGATMTLHAQAGIGEAKKKKKKCKKPNSCQERICCTCRDPMTFIVELCDYIPPTADFSGACATFCQGHSLVLFQASGTVANQANYCDLSLKCVRLNCPVP